MRRIVYLCVTFQEILANKKPFDTCLFFYKNNLFFWFSSDPTKLPHMLFRQIRPSHSDVCSSYTFDFWIEIIPCCCCYAGFVCSSKLKLHWEVTWCFLKEFIQVLHFLPSVLELNEAFKNSEVSSFHTLAKVNLSVQELHASISFNEQSVDW